MLALGGPDELMLSVEMTRYVATGANLLNLLNLMAVITQHCSRLS
jgi:hypothetical protein